MGLFDEFGLGDDEKKKQKRRKTQQGQKNQAIPGFFQTIENSAVNQAKTYVAEPTKPYKAANQIGQKLTGGASKIDLPKTDFGYSNAEKQLSLHDWKGVYKNAKPTVRKHALRGRAALDLAVNEGSSVLAERNLKPPKFETPKVTVPDVTVPGGKKTASGLASRLLKGSDGSTRRGIGKAATKYGKGALSTVGKYGDDVAKKLGGPVDLLFWGAEMNSINRKRNRGKLSKRQANVRRARATGGLVGGVAGAALGSALGPAGSVVGGVVGEAAGRYIGGLAGKHLFGSGKKRSSLRPSPPIKNTSMSNARRRSNRPANATFSPPPSSRGNSSINITEVARNSTTPPDPDRPPRTNRAKANKQNRQRERVVEKRVERRPVETHDVDRKIEEAKQDAVREMERRLGPRPTPF
ncbi:hypothetical protein [Halorussus salinus]|uniref:hypothetical protein n=1 Tax=Halorussus salinus TaxID=1364935 RepID=UPI00138F9696|nr:hypothetical protein [Halorussus salinus]